MPQNASREMLCGMRREREVAEFWAHFRVSIPGEKGWVGKMKKKIKEFQFVPNNMVPTK